VVHAGAPYDVAALTGCLVCPFGALVGGALGLIAGVGLVRKQGQGHRTRRGPSHAKES
jgi:hypothetical protein